MITEAIKQALLVELATRAELDATLSVFKGAVYRESAAGIIQAQQGAERALQSHLDAVSASWAIIKRETRP